MIEVPFKKLNIPNSVYVAVSGGVDSMVALDFLSKGPRDVIALHYNHGTDYGHRACEIVKDFCTNRNITLHVGENENQLPDKPSEAYFRDLRFSFFSQFDDRPIITGHNLNDAVEWYLFTSFRGNPRYMPMKGKTLKAFLMNHKDKNYKWAHKNKVPFLEDHSNKDSGYDRNRIRNVILPEVLKINPGLYKSVKKHYLQNLERNEHGT